MWRIATQWTSLGSRVPTQKPPEQSVKCKGHTGCPVGGEDLGKTGTLGTRHGLSQKWLQTFKDVFLWWLFSRPRGPQLFRHFIFWKRKFAPILKQPPKTNGKFGLIMGWIGLMLFGTVPHQNGYWWEISPLIHLEKIAPWAPGGGRHHRNSAHLWFSPRV